LSFFPRRVILNEVKNLNTLCLCVQILRDAQDDTSGREWHFYFANQLKIVIFAPNEAEKIHSLDVNGCQHRDVDGIGLAPSPSSGDSLLATRCGGLRMCFPL